MILESDCQQTRRTAPMIPASSASAKRWSRWSKSSWTHRTPRSAITPVPFRAARPRSLHRPLAVLRAPTASRPGSSEPSATTRSGRHSSTSWPRMASTRVTCAAAMTTQPASRSCSSTATVRGPSSFPKALLPRSMRVSGTKPTSGMSRASTSAARRSRWTLASGKHAFGLWTWPVSRNPTCFVTFDPNFRIEMADPKQTLEWARPVLARTTHLLPSGGELEFLMQSPRLDEACRAAFAQCNRLLAIVAKRGPLGCTVFERSAPAVGQQVSGYPANERFPTGAGDNFGAAFLVGLLERAVSRRRCPTRLRRGVACGRRARPDEDIHVGRRAGPHGRRSIANRSSGRAPTST